MWRTCRRGSPPTPGNEGVGGVLGVVRIVDEQVDPTSLMLQHAEAGAAPRLELESHPEPGERGLAHRRHGPIFAAAAGGAG